MSIKADKTFEEIVERLVALFRPLQEEPDRDARAQAASSESVERRPPRSAIPSLRRRRPELTRD